MFETVKFFYSNNGYQAVFTWYFYIALYDIFLLVCAVHLTWLVESEVKKLNCKVNNNRYKSQDIMYEWE